MLGSNLYETHPHSIRIDNNIQERREYTISLWQMGMYYARGGIFVFRTGLSLWAWRSVSNFFADGLTQAVDSGLGNAHDSN